MSRYTSRRAPPNVTAPEVSQPSRCVPAGAGPSLQARGVAKLPHHGRLLGITADLNLSLYLIKKYCGREIALQSARCTLVDLDRIAQAPFAVFNPEKNHSDSEILKSQEWIEENYRKNVNLDALANTAGMSRRQFNRRFKSATGEIGTKIFTVGESRSGKNEPDKHGTVV